jgi:hypothetical protein
MICIALSRILCLLLLHLSVSVRESVFPGFCINMPAFRAYVWECLQHKESEGMTDNSTRDGEWVDCGVSCQAKSLAAVLK